MNLVCLTGRLTSDPKIFNGNVARMSIAVKRRFVREGQPDVDFINLVAYGKTAEFCEKYLAKGSKVDVSGRIQTGSYTNKDGQVVNTVDVAVDNIEFGESKKAAAPVAKKDDFINVDAGIGEEMPFA